MGADEVAKFVSSCTKMTCVAADECV